MIMKALRAFEREMSSFLIKARMHLVSRVRLLLAGERWQGHHSKMLFSMNLDGAS